MKTTQATLYKMNDLGWTFAHPTDDIRTYHVINECGEKIGKVEDLMIDELEHKTRYMQVGEGGILGLGETRFLIPVEAITLIENDTVHIDRNHKSTKKPVFDPEMVETELDCCFTGNPPYIMGTFMYQGFPTCIKCGHK